MAAQKEILNLRPVELDDAALADFARALAFDTAGGLASLQERLQGAQVFAIEQGGRRVCHYALKVLRHAHGAEGVIVCAGGNAPGVDLTASVVPAIERQFLGVRAVKVTTARRGLVRKLAGQGYRVAAWELRKFLDH